MSVFDLPRLHFTGTATTKLPTGPRCGLIDMAANRALTAEGIPFPADRPATDYHAYLQQRGPHFDKHGHPDARGEFSAAKGWNFDGNSHFWLDAVIMSVQSPENGGAPDTEDPVVGRSVDVWGHYNEYLRSTANRARVFDVDPASRWTMALMVGQFGFGRLGRSHDTPYAAVGGVSGIHPPRWVGFDHVRELGEHALAPHLGYSAVHQFAVPKGGLDWPADMRDSPAVTALRSAMDEADGLVVQLALDNMASPMAPDAPNHWRVRGTIAPWGAHELRGYPAGRLLVPLGPGGPLRHLTVEVAGGRAHFNMITAVPATGRAGHAGPGPLHRLGPPLDSGDLELRTAGPGRLVARLPAGTYPGDTTSGILTVPAEPGWEEAADHALYLTGDGPGGRRKTLLTERETNIQTDEAMMVVHHRDHAHHHDHAVRVPLRSYVRGRLTGPAKVHVRQYFNPRALPGDHPAGGADARCGDAVLLGLRGVADYAEECVVETDEHGHGLLTLRGERAGTCRVLLRTDPADAPAADPGARGSAWTAYDDQDALGYWAGAGALAVRVLPDDWHLDDVPRQEVDFGLLHREVFAYYEHISSFMRSDVFSLEDQFKVDTYADLVWQMCDPLNRTKTYYMPPTRDLSDPKARLMLAYLRNHQARARPPVPVPATLPTAGPVIATRGELWTVLKQAATLELAVMLQYLYAAFSLPTHGAGLEYVRRGKWTSAQLAHVCGRGGETKDDGMRGALLNVAREEMIHFLTVNNIIMAMGEPFHVPLIDFGTLNSTLPVPLDFALEPLSLGSVQRYITIEQPARLTPDLRRENAARPGPGPATAFSWGSISELYAGVRQGLERVPDLFMVERGRGGGEHHLFLRESVNSVHPDYQLQVDDLSSALFAVDLITEQGEGATPNSADAQEVSHFETFLGIGELLAGERLPGPHGRLVPWNPAYPALRNPTVGAGDAAKDPITDQGTRAVAQMFNRSYYLMLQLMVQHFGESPDASLRRSKLMGASIDVMTGMMRPLAELLVTMDSGRRGRTAGPTFELETPPVPVSRPDVARRSLALRFAHLSAATRELSPVPGQVADMMSFYADFFRHDEQRR